ncbi:hypothetical protein FO519_001205 [Halicephalobus sp. NKZ332]|nr:hypothetical protein FO519_001205 [Halicephalobus sp. NKZ332]
MELFFELHDNEGICHNKFQSKFSAQATLDQLQEKIHSNFNIHQERQHLFSVDGKKIKGLSSSTLLEIGLKNFDKIVVKHSMVANWKVFKTNFELAQKVLQLKQINGIDEPVDQALDQLRPLVRAKFFVAYPTFDDIHQQFKAEFSRYIDQNFKYIELAAYDYFSKFFNDNPECPVVKIICEKKELAGIQGGLICNVTKSGVLIGKYHVKEHIGLANYQNADLRELFVYRLLELIQVDDHTSSTKVNKYLEGYKSWKGTKELRIRVGKDCFASWNLSSMLSQADAGIAKQKELFKKKSITYKPSKNYDEYLERVKKNVTTLAMLFE